MSNGRSPILSPPGTPKSSTLPRTDRKIPMKYEDALIADVNRVGIRFNCNLPFILKTFFSRFTVLPQILSISTKTSTSDIDGTLYNVISSFESANAAPAKHIRVAFFEPSHSISPVKNLLFLTSNLRSFFAIITSLFHILNIKLDKEPNQFFNLIF